MTDGLTYYEYWAAKEIWNLCHAIDLLYDICQFKRPWKVTEDSFTVYSDFFREMTAQLLKDDADAVFAKKTTVLDGRDGEGNYIPTGLNAPICEVYPNKFIVWAHSHGYQLPYEFKLFVGLQEIEPRLTQKAEERMDKAVCQGIGKTLWDIYPKISNEELQYHNAIQVYGAGRYTGDTTLRRWLSEVDPREKKRGRKKS